MYLDELLDGGCGLLVLLGEIFFLGKQLPPVRSLLRAFDRFARIDELREGSCTLTGLLDCRPSICSKLLGSDMLTESSINIYTSQYRRSDKLYNSVYIIPDCFLLPPGTRILELSV